MTLSISWLRSTETTQELVIATDSRLRFGCAWDCCPKIMTLSRGDAALCFAGDTMHAYPIMLQMKSSIEQHYATRTRERDLTDLRRHLIEVANGMRDHIRDLPAGQTQPDIPEAVIIFGGYSWRDQEFVIFLFHFDPHLGRFTFRPASPWRGQACERKIVFAGDYVDEARERLIDLLRLRGKLDSGGFDMEPFEVLRDVIRDNAHPSIGGPPQVIKIYRHLNTVPIAVRWPYAEDGQLSFLGRPLLPYERTLYPVLDPDSLDIATSWSFHSQEAE